MKKILIIVALSLACIMAGAQSRREVTDSVAFMPTEVRIYEGVTKNGNPKWWIELPTNDGIRKVTLSQSHVTSGRMLALIERRDVTSGRYYYSVKFAEPARRKSEGKADLSSLK